MRAIEANPSGLQRAAASRIAEPQRQRDGRWSASRHAPAATRITRSCRVDILEQGAAVLGKRRRCKLRTMANPGSRWETAIKFTGPYGVGEKGPCKNARLLVRPEHLALVHGRDRRYRRAPAFRCLSEAAGHADTGRNSKPRHECAAREESRLVGTHNYQPRGRRAPARSGFWGFGLLRRLAAGKGRQSARAVFEERA